MCVCVCVCVSSSSSTEFQAVQPIEVVLQPGDVLYIPPFYFHHVCVVGDSPSISISTHTESHVAKVRGTLLRKSELFWARVAHLIHQATADKQALRVVLFAQYLTLLFDGSSSGARSFANKLIESHWSHLHLDRSAVGLQELLANGAAQFPDLQAINRARAADTKVLDKIVLEMRQHIANDLQHADLLGGIKDSATRDIIVAEHIEVGEQCRWHCCILLGALTMHGDGSIWHLSYWVHTRFWHFSSTLQRPSKQHQPICKSNPATAAAATTTTSNLYNNTQVVFTTTVTTAMVAMIPTT
jgi:hypothetical protein